MAMGRSTDGLDDTGRIGENANAGSSLLGLGKQNGVLLWGSSNRIISLNAALLDAVHTILLRKCHHYYIHPSSPSPTQTGFKVERGILS